MIDFLLQLISLFLVAAGLLFIVIELFVRFDRSFLFLGLALIIFGLVPAVDIWIIPHQYSPAALLFWTRIQHVLAFILFPVILWYLKSFLKSNVRYFLHLVIVLVIILSPMLFSNAALSLNGNGEIVFGPWYYYLFVPCACLAGGITVWLITRKLRGARDNERRILFYHLIGFALLCAFGCIDLAVRLLRNVFTTPLPSFFIFGVFAFGMMAFLIFTERFLLLVRERQTASDNLRVALREMEEASTLRQIGESTSIINHEIKNYLTAISGSAELIKLTENLSADGKEEIAAIMKKIKDLQNFSLEILQLSRARMIKEKEPLTIVPLLRQCIGSYFPEHRERIIIKAANEDCTLYGEWNKLEHVFVNLFKNALEAGATAITVEVQSANAVILITIADNGSGCTAEQRANLFKVFYTTKKGKQGTGLGLAISRAVIESHGGHITVYPLNGLGDGSHGLQIHITLPQAVNGGKFPETRQHSIVLIKDGIDDIGAVLQVFNNAGVYPLVIPSAGELEKRKGGGEITVVASETMLKPLRRIRTIEDRRIVLLCSKDGMRYARGADIAAPLRIFSEGFVITLPVLMSPQTT